MLISDASHMLGGFDQACVPPAVKSDQRAGPFALKCCGNVSGYRLRRAPQGIVIKVRVTSGGRYLRVTE